MFAPRVARRGASGRDIFCTKKTLPEWIYPGAIILDQAMGTFNFIRRQARGYFLERYGRIGVTSDRAKRVPRIGAHHVGRGQSTAGFIVPSDPRLGTGVTFEAGAQIPIKRPFIVAFDPQPHGIHHTNQFLGIRIPGPCKRGQRRMRLLKFTLFHQIARLFDVGHHGRGKQRQSKGYVAHVLSLLFWVTPVGAQSLGPDDFLPADPAQARIGQLLFYDKILSGNRNIACATCHHHDLASGDGLSLGIGEGGHGLGHQRTPGTGANRIIKRIPRNAPALWNLGHRDVDVLFHDGRLEVSDLYGNGFNSPAEEWLPQGLDNILAAQALFPLVAQFEMAGNLRENEVTGAVHDRIDAAWPILAKRVRIIPEYGEMFVQAFDHIDHPEQVTIVEIANAIAAFEISEWQSYDSPFDAYLTGIPLPEQAERGRQLFFDRAGCAQCHSGPLFTDQAFHALGLPAFGPGRTRRFDPIPRDVGRMGETDLLADAYRFRTPSLRNVALTAPYGHNGAYPTLDSIIRHHANPLEARQNWSRNSAELPTAPWLEAIDFAIQSDQREMQRQAATLDITPVSLSDTDVADLVAFLQALTGETALYRPLGQPLHVPSGLPVDVVSPP